MWETFPILIQSALALGALLGGGVGGAIWARSKFNSVVGDRLNGAMIESRKENEIRIADLEVALDERTQTEIMALQKSVDALQDWNGLQQTTIQSLAQANDELKNQLADAKKDRNNLRDLVAKLHLDNAVLEGEIIAYKELLNTLLANSPPHIGVEED